MGTFSDEVESLRRLLDRNQLWFLGAGASVDSNVPLMIGLTDVVSRGLNPAEKDVFDCVHGELTTGCHIEHVLSQLVDMVALAGRRESQTMRLGDRDVSLAELQSVYRAIIRLVTETVRFGYHSIDSDHPAEVVGKLESPMLDVVPHRNFVRAVFSNVSNLEGRVRIGFVTTNYDTLLEDALALEKRIPLDGFSGSSVAFWSGRGLEVEDEIREPTDSHLVLKLHGSVDWFKDPEAGVLRIRYGVRYLSTLDNTLIYPQATKYVETQKDPFAKIFSSFRRLLTVGDASVLAIVGYSFGDEHINLEIENALSLPGNQAVVIVFSREQVLETPEGGKVSKLRPKLEEWRNNPQFGNRIYVASDCALYCGPDKIPAPQTMNWVRFTGLIDFLKSGIDR